MCSSWCMCKYLVQLHQQQKKKPFRNASASRRTKLLQSPDRLWSLIKQGISGLYGDYHYRPLEQSSQNVFLSPQALAQWFSMDYMRPQDMSPHSLNQFLHLPPFNKDWFFFFFFYNTAWHSSTWKKILNIQSWICTYPGYPFVGFHEDAPERFVANTPWQHLRLAQWSTDHFPKSPRHPEGEGETCRCDFCFSAQFRHMIHEARFCQRTLPSRLFVFFLSTRWTHQRLFAFTYKRTVTVSNPTARLLYWNIFAKHM